MDHTPHFILSCSTLEHSLAKACFMFSCSWQDCKQNLKLWSATHKVSLSLGKPTGNFNIITSTNYMVLIMNRLMVHGSIWKVWLWPQTRPLLSEIVREKKWTVDFTTVMTHWRSSKDRRSPTECHGVTLLHRLPTCFNCQFNCGSNPWRNTETANVCPHSDRIISRAYFITHPNWSPHLPYVWLFLFSVVQR